MMTEDDIRVLNCDFNYHNYGVFYEKIEEEANAAAAAASGANEADSKGADEAPGEGAEANGKAAAS